MTNKQVVFPPVLLKYKIHGGPRGISKSVGHSWCPYFACIEDAVRSRKVVKARFMALDNRIRLSHSHVCILVTFKPFKPEFTIVIFIHYKPRIAVAILDL